MKKELTPSRPGTRDGRPITAASSPGNASPAGADGSMMNPAYAESSRMAMEAAARPLAHGQMRPRSAAEAGGCRLENGIYIDRHLERKLVGSLTNSYLFQPGGLVKKVSDSHPTDQCTVTDAEQTMTLTISGFHQHVVSYYTLEDAVAGRLRRPSTIPEFAALEISPEYLNVANFRYPPSIDVDNNGIPHYHGEPDDRPTSPSRGIPQYGSELYDTYGAGGGLDAHHQPRLRSVTVPNMGSNFSPAYPMHTGGSSGYYESQPVHGMPIPRQAGPVRSMGGSRRYDPYSGHRGSQLVPQGSGDTGHHRRLSQPPPATDPNYYPGSDYNYQPPSTAPGAFTYYNSTGQPPPQNPPMASPMVSPTYGSASYGTWHQPAQALRMMPSNRPDLSDNPPPSSSGSLESTAGSGAAHVMPSDWAAGLPTAGTAAPVWDSHPPQMSHQYAVQQGSEGWQASLA